MPQGAGVVGVVLGVVGLVCSCVALGIPYWQDVDTGTVAGTHGLFRYTLTVAGTETSGDYLEYLSGSDRTSLIAVRGLVVSGAILLVAVACLGPMFACYVENKVLGIFTAVAAFLTGILHTAGALIFRIMLTEGGNSSLHAGFYLVTITAAIAAAAGGLLLKAAIAAGKHTHDKNANKRRTDRSSRKPNNTVHEKVIVAGVIVFLVLVCSSVSLGIPYWQEFGAGLTGNHGLFRYSSSTSGVETSGDYIDVVAGSDRDALFAVRGLMGCGTGLTLLAFITVVVYIVYKEQYTTGFIGAAFCFLSGAVHVAAVVVFRVKLRLADDTGFHAGFYLAIVAAVLACIAGALVIVDAASVLSTLTDGSDKRATNRAPRADMPKRKSNYTAHRKVTGVGLCVVGLALWTSSLSFWIPFWQGISSATTTGNHGLFSYSIASSGMSTAGDYMDLVTGSDKDALYAVRGLVGSGIVLTTLAFIAVAVYIFYKEQYPTGFIGAAFCFLSGAVHLAGVVVFWVYLELDGGYEFHAGFYLAIVTAVSVCIAGTIVVVDAVTVRNMLKNKPGQRANNRAERTDIPSRNSNYSTHRKVSGAGLCVVILASLCSIASLGLPLWQEFDSGTITVSHGLFQYRIVLLGVEVSSGDYMDLVTGSDEDALFAVRGLSGSGTGLTLIGVIAVAVFFVYMDQYVVGFIGAAFCFSTGAVHLAGVVVFWVHLELDGGYEFHAGFYLAIVATALACVAGTIVVVDAAIVRYGLKDEHDLNHQVQRRPTRRRPNLADNGSPATEQYTFTRETAARNDAIGYRRSGRQEHVMASPTGDDQSDVYEPRHMHVQRDHRNTFRRQNKVNPARMSTSTVYSQWNRGPAGPKLRRVEFANSGRPTAEQYQETTTRNDASGYRRHTRQNQVMASPISDNQFEVYEPRDMHVQQDNRHKLRRHNKVNPERKATATIDSQWDQLEAGTMTKSSKHAHTYSKQMHSYDKITNMHDKSLPSHAPSQWPRVAMSETEMNIEQRRQVWQRPALQTNLMTF